MMIPFQKLVLATAHTRIDHMNVVCVGAYASTKPESKDGNIHTFIGTLEIWSKIVLVPCRPVHTKCFFRVFFGCFCYKGMGESSAEIHHQNIDNKKSLVPFEAWHHWSFSAMMRGFELSRIRLEISSTMAMIHCHSHVQ